MCFVAYAVARHYWDEGMLRWVVIRAPKIGPKLGREIQRT